MKTSTLIFALLIICLIFSSCKSSIRPDDLYGKWKYIKVDKPNTNPPDSVRISELKAEAPYIQFSKDDSLLIYWGGKVLSQGKFTTDGRNIRYTESLKGGATRQFPFWVMSLNDKQIVFETLGEDGSRVTAVKE